MGTSTDKGKELSLLCKFNPQLVKSDLQADTRHRDCSAGPSTYKNLILKLNHVERFGKEYAFNIVFKPFIFIMLKIQRSPISSQVTLKSGPAPPHIHTLEERPLSETQGSESCMCPSIEEPKQARCSSPEFSKYNYSNRWDYDPKVTGITGKLSC